MYGLVYMVVFTVIGVPTVPRTAIGILQPLLLLLTIRLSRFVARYFLYDAYSRILRQSAQVKTRSYMEQVRRVGNGGGALSHGSEFKVVGFLDDDANLQGMSLNGVKIIAPIQ